METMGELSFQFTRPQGARPFLRPSTFHLAVSIHAPARGATTTMQCSVNDLRFQFTRPQGARPNQLQTAKARNGFNSRARKGRDIGKADNQRMLRVSIHAPARGATADTDLKKMGGTVSIHAPARGATLVPCGKCPACLFQFTRPQGARRRFDIYWHIPSCFNSRARKGRDRVSSLAWMFSELFQFTRPQGARQTLITLGPSLSSFNSRARKGRD